MNVGRIYKYTLTRPIKINKNDRGQVSTKTVHRPTSLKMDALFGQETKVWSLLTLVFLARTQMVRHGQAFKWEPTSTPTINRCMRKNQMFSHLTPRHMALHGIKMENHGQEYLVKEQRRPTKTTKSPTTL